MREHAPQLPENHNEPFSRIRSLHGPDRLNWFEDEGIGFYPVKEAPYDQAYFDKYSVMAATIMGREITKFRVVTVNKFFPADEYGLIDIGIGCGSFVEERNKVGSGYLTFGYDINPVGVEWLNKRGLFLNPYTSYPRAISCWDSFEHIEKPEELLDRVRGWVFMSIPIFRDLEHILISKHFRKDEHFWYFTHDGLVKAMKAYGFDLHMYSMFETAMGREDIGTFIFKRT